MKFEVRPQTTFELQQQHSSAIWHSFLPMFVDVGLQLLTAGLLFFDGRPHTDEASR